MRDKCPKCGAPPGPKIEHPGDGAGLQFVCSNAKCRHVFTIPTVDFEHTKKGEPVAFWMPRDRWEALPLYTGVLQGEATLYRDAEALGVVYRWMGSWWQATLSFKPTRAADHPD
jgi:hypothetical protein